MKKVLVIFWVTLLLGLFGLTSGKAFGQSVAVADESEVDRRFVEALRERFLFQTAEEYCRLRLAEKDLSGRGRALLFVQYLICLRDHAESLPPPRRDELWELAARTTREFSFSESVGDDANWATLQFALLRISQGRLLREEQELFGRQGASTGGNQSGEIESVRAPLREAIRDLRELEKVTAEKLQAVAAASVPTTSEGVWSESEWLGFEKTVQFHLAAAEMELALTYPEDGPDRAAALAESQRRLQILAQLPPDHPLALDSRLALARACRLLRQWDLARAALAAIDETSLSPRALLRVRAESLRLALDSGDAATVERILSLGREYRGETLSAYDFALMEAYWTLRNSAEKEERPTEPWNLKIVEILDALRQGGDPYWVRRAELFLAGRGGSTLGDDDAMSAVAAENAFRAGRIEEALAGYDRAQAAAARRGGAVDAFRYGLTAAAIASDRGDHREAFRRFAELADRFGDQPQAAEADLMAIHHLAVLVQSDPAQYLDTFLSRIRTFLSRHPGHPKAGELRLRLAQSLELMGKRREAAEEYWQLVLSLPGPTDPQEEADRTRRWSAMDGFARCESEYFQSIVAAGKDPAAEVAEVAARLDAWVQQVRQADSGDTAIRDPAVREAIRLSAQMRLEHHLPAQQAAAGLATAIQEAESAQLPQQEYAEILFLAAVARILSGDRTVPPLSPGSWDADTLRRVMQSGDCVLQAITDEAAKRRLAEFLVGLTDGLEASRRSSWTSAERQAFGESRARWLTLARRLDAALQAYGELAERLPDRGDIQEAMVLLLVQKADTASLEAALNRLLELTRRSPEGSARWFRAKYLTAWCLARLNRRRQAAELIAVVETLYPDLGGSETRELFLQLKRQCEAASQ
ncbi:hypothetical protein [Thermopirellula anaerolimosa]